MGRRRSAEETVADAPDFGFVIDIRHLIDGDEFGKDSESGASGVVFELGAIELETFARKSELLAGDVEIFAFNANVFVLMQGARNGAVGRRS